MLFFLQKKLNDPRGLFFRLVVISSTVHVITLGVLFFFESRRSALDKFVFNTRRSGMQISTRAHGPAGLSKNGSQGNAHSSARSEKGAPSNGVPRTPINQKEVSVPTSNKQNERVTPTVKEVKAKPAVAPAKVVPAEVVKPVEAPPAFSEFKRTFTHLKRGKKKGPRKPLTSLASSTIPSSMKDVKSSEQQKNTTPLKEKIVEKVEPQKQTNEVPHYSELKKRVTPESTTTALPQEKAVPVVNNQQSVSNYEGHNASGGNASESLDFAADEPASSDNTIIREISHHYRRPPGFQEHESFVFTFEIKGGKAVNIGPQGNEPLVIYTAIKDAVLKATFAHTNHAKRIELSIK